VKAVARDAERAVAGRAHREAYGPPKKAARISGHHLATEYRWGESGPPELLSSYFANTPRKYRMVAHLLALALREQLEPLTREQLIDRCRQLRHEIAQQYAEVLRLEAEGAAQLDQAAASERLAGLLEERAAAHFLCAARRITAAELWGSR
jgi:hypothetical protein